MSFATRLRRATAVAASAAIAVAGLATGAAAASTVVVTKLDTQGWSTADTRPGGDVKFIIDESSPAPTGVLQLTTDATTTAKAQYLHESHTPLSNVTELSYYTKQVSGPAFADPSYQLPVLLDGTAGSFTTLVFEPYQNGVVATNMWQQWDVDSGQFWSSRSFSSGACTVVAGAGGPPFYTLSGLKTMCPSAIVVGFGVNIGSNNPSYNVETDLFDFNGTVYDFQVTPSDKDQCKDGGYKNFTDAQGNPFKNQGQCVSFTNHN